MGFTQGGESPARIDRGSKPRPRRRIVYVYKYHRPIFDINTPFVRNAVYLCETAAPCLETRPIDTAMNGFANLKTSPKAIYDT